ncbi:hypothetical protein LWI29_013333 [Acer saccharum]|uniref:PGG domain-containing protein n=1 Tax=Acer saccharum TaxID=4024 RepID=A0AA39SSC4_ACESA|nr:hypothetical protein LWI29_013333 [Acer saccharum]
MERRIYEAAVEGSVISLRKLLQEDALVLDRFLVGYYPETPLHIASMLGHLDFVQEILKQKPEKAGELDARKSSPLHLATAKGYCEIVRKLLSVNPEMCFACDRDGRNPLHIATIKGHISVLRELVNVRPQAAQMSIDHRGETILHLCVRYSGQLEMLKLLVETIGDNGFMNSKDDDGNTILHTAVADKQVELIKYLTKKTAIEVNALNAYGFTALDLLTHRKDEVDREIEKLLQSSGAMHAKDIHLSKHELGSENVHKKKKDWAEKMGNALMVVASLTATMAFQVAINPPGGVWQEQDSTVQQGSADSQSESPHTVGVSVLSDHKPNFYSWFLNFNTTGFMASCSIILLQISGLPIKNKFFMWILMVIMWIAISAMTVTYMLASIALSELADTFNTGLITMLIWFGLVGMLFLVHVIRLIKKMIKCVIKSIRQPRQHSSNMA